MKRVPQIFLAAFLTDGLLSLAALAIPSLSSFQEILAVVVFLAAMVLHLAMMCMPRLPKRVLLPATVFAIWCALTNAFPSGLVFGNHAQAVLALAESLLGAGLLLTLRGPASGLVCLRPAFSWPNFFTVSFLNCFLALGLGILMVLAGLSMVEQKTAGYVRIRPDGISLEERWFQRGDGKSVRLVGMVHVAKDQFYNDLAATLPEKEPAIVLLEGITDNDSLLREKLTYSNLADSLGLTSQSDSDFMKKASKKSRESRPHSGAGPADDLNPAGIQYWRADVDTSDFQTSTLDCIEAVGNLFSSRTLGEVVRKLADPNSPLNQQSGNEVFWSDVVDMRNEHLIDEMKEALRQANIVVVPWGALHMPVFEKQLKDWGFYETYRVRRLAFSFQKQTLSQAAVHP